MQQSKLSMHQTRTITAAILILALAHSVKSSSSHHPKKEKFHIVTTPFGPIQGSELTSRLGKTIYSFRGIRYAEAPVGELRFQPPVPVEEYEGTYNATEDAPLCPQPLPFPTSEDCLFLNVYTTKLPKKGEEHVKRPVIVHIHPGGFYSAGSASYWAGPQYFMDQDIILVTFNYRLGSLGFLATGDKESPGNNGLKDQVVVLKWVKQNIEAFGGDASSVTILGYSAGAISVVLHMVSPMSVGLFHKAVAMSGSATSQWTIKHDQLDLAKKQARFVGCPDDTTANIVKCLKTKSAKELGNSLQKFGEFGPTLLLIWEPVIEKDFGQTRFLTAQPITSILNGQFQNVPFITGQTKDEFAYIAVSVVDNETLREEINEKWYETAPIAFLYERNSTTSRKISKGLRKFYFDDKPIDNCTLTNLGELYADATVGFGVNRAVKLISERNTASSFYYKFSYQGRYSHYYLPGSNDTKPFGVVHHDDLIYLFYISIAFPLFKKHTPKEVEMVEKLTLIYANFAKYGNPIPTPTEKLDNVTWETFNTETKKYLDIGSKLKMRENLFEERFDEWETLFPLDIIHNLNDK